MGYTLHEMNVLLFSKEDSVFGDTALGSPDDNVSGGDVIPENDEDKENDW